MRTVTSSAGPLDRILASLHEAALDEARWPEADRTMGEINRMSGSALTLHETQGTHAAVLLTRICLAGRRRKDWESRYFNDYWAGDEAAPRIARLEPGRLVSTGDLYTDAEKKTSATYNEALVDTKARNGLYMRLDAPNDLGVIWGLCDSTERGGWTSDQIRLLRELHPPVRHRAPGADRSGGDGHVRDRPPDQSAHRGPPSRAVRPDRDGERPGAGDPAEGRRSGGLGWAPMRPAAGGGR